MRDPALPDGLPGSLRTALSAGAIESFLVPRGHRIVGLRIRDLDLRPRTGSTVLAVLRGETTITNPPADLVLADEDVLVIVGSHGGVEDALRSLETGC